jgi:hypothetical protein
MSTLTLKTEGEKYVVVTRRFAAPPEAVYRAHTDPKLVQKWMLGPEGWSMPVCIGELCTWSACTCRTQRRIIISKRHLKRTATAH